MSVSSLIYFIFLAFALLLYYVLPKRWQWKLLLIGSGIFFLCAGNVYTILYLLASIIVTTYTAKRITQLKAAADADPAQQTKKQKNTLLIGILVNVGILALLKYSNFVINNTNSVLGLFGVTRLIPQLSLAAPLGLSFYTLQIVGYLLDVYWGIVECQPSYAKTALFISYFPQLTSGPIARYEEMKDQLYAEHAYDEQQIKLGLERILYGLFKKLIISGRAGIIVDTIYGNPESYPGLYVWLAAGLFMLQLYTDFSGCMDIIIGTSQCFGIRLPENFRTPFFSRSIQEFWQRWHITLGAWLKDYILYIVLRTRLWKKLKTWCKGRMSKKLARQVPAWLSMLVVWLLIGLWHGGKWKYILGQGLWYWALIVLGQACEPGFKKIIAVLRINTKTFSWHLFQSLRVYFLVCFGNMFFRIESLGETLREMKNGISVFNPQIFFDGSLYQLGLDEKNLWLLVISLLILLGMSAMQETESIRARLARQNFLFRRAVLMLTLFAIIILGTWGPGYDAQAFIYAGF